MSVHDEAIRVYRYLVETVLPSSTTPTTTYGAIEQNTGVPIGPEGGHIGTVLGEVSRSCNSILLPPLTVIVLPKGDVLPSSGYFVELAQFLRDGNPGGWPIDPGVARWIARPKPRGFDKSDNRYEHQGMIAAHKKSVWDYHDLPPTI